MGFWTDKFLPIAAGIGVGIATQSPQAGIATAKATREIFDDDGNSKGTITEMDDGTFRNDSGATVDEEGNIVAPADSGTWQDSVGTFLQDNADPIGAVISRLIFQNPEMDYDKIIELALQQSRINSPNVYTPQGQSITTWNEETGQPDVTQSYTPEVQALFEGLVGNAGAPIDPYAAPDAMGGSMLTALINEREQSLGIPQSELRRKGPVNYWDDEDE